MAAPDLQQVFSGVLTPTQLMQQRLMRDTQLQNSLANDESRPWRLELARSLDNAAYSIPGTPQYKTQQQANDNQNTLNSATKKYQQHLDSGMSADDAQLAVLNDAITDFANKGNYDAVSALAPSYLALQQKQAQIAKLYQEGKKDAVETAARAQDSNSLAADRASQIADRSRKAANDEAEVSTKDIVDLVNPKIGTVTAAQNPDGSVQYTDPQSGQLVTRKPGQFKTAPTGNGAGGSNDARTQMVFQRVVNGADLGVTDLENIVREPASISSGLFGVGSTEYKGGILSVPKAALASKLSGTDARNYNTMITGLKRNLSGIETSGLAPGARFTDSLSNIEFSTADTQENKLYKLAQARQIIEHGLNSWLVSPRITDEQKDYVKELQDRVQKAIPFTIKDVQNLKSTKNDKATISDLITSKGLDNNTTGDGWSVRKVK